jgi:hypothetical protein
MNTQKAHKPKDLDRVETGPLQFDEDWPGVFIRGDNAGYYCMILRQYLDKIDNPIDKAVLEGLASTLESCIIGPAKEILDIPPKTLRMLDESIENFKKGIVSDPINLEDK